MPDHTAASNLRDFDAVVVGAGFAGLYALYRLRGMGLSVQVYERGSGVGGTWYWNRYPGARCDVESMEYFYQFSDALQQDWEWTKRYATQPEILDYANHVADRFDLRRNIRFDTRVESAVYDEDARRWRIGTDSDGSVSARFVVMATGCLSSLNRPEFPGLAELLCPSTVIGCKRLCVDTGYYATFNRPNVTLVDVSERSIERFTPGGLVTGGREYAFDSVVFATGFDAMTGALLGIDIRGRGELGPGRQRGRQRDAVPEMQLLVSGRQRAGQATGVHALHRLSRLCREMRSGRRGRLRGVPSGSILKAVRFRVSGCSSLNRTSGLRYEGVRPSTASRLRSTPFISLTESSVNGPSPRRPRSRVRG